MKKRFKYAQWGLAAITVLTLSACDDFDPLSQKGEFYYSNPTTSNISFKIDDKFYEVLPGQRDIIKLSSGKHKLENSQGDIFSFMVFDNNNGGIINPDNHVYYTLSEAYAVEGKADRFKPATYEVVINGHELEMAVRSANATVIDANIFKCDYPLGEAFPDSITVNDRKSVGNIQSKCFDKPELVQYIATEYNENISPDTPDEATQDTVNMSFSYDLPAADFTNPKLQAKAQELLALLKPLQDTNDTDVHEKLNKQAHQLMIELVEIHANSASSSTVAENEKYNNFVSQIGELRGYGIWGR